MQCDQRVLTGAVGWLGAILTGAGEGLLHYAPAGFGDPVAYHFFTLIPERRIFAGHFLSIFAGPLYLIGYYHIYRMLEPAPRQWRLAVLLTGWYSFFVGIAWLGSRAYLAILAQAEAQAHGETLEVLQALLEKAAFLNENILTVTRLGVLAISVMLPIIILRGQTQYPRWFVWINPILLVLLSFLLYLVVPPIGSFLMPIAMNAAHVVFFSLSTWIAWHLARQEQTPSET